MINDPMGLMGALNSYRQSLQTQREQLMQPAPQQGGFLANADPVMLSLAAGLLSPTKAGSFGESIGAGLAAASGPLAEIRKQEAARADKLGALNAAEAKLALDMLELQQGGRYGRARDPALNVKIYGDLAKQNAELAASVGEDDPRYQGYMEDAQYYAGLAKAISEGGSDAPSPKDRNPGAFPTVKTPEEALKLPSGTQFYDPDGVLRKVP